MSQLVESRQFGAGLTAGIIVALATLAIVLVWSRRRPATVEGERRFVPGAIGVGFALGTLTTIAGVGPFEQEVHVPTEVIVGLVALWCAGVISARLPRPMLAGILLALPGGVLLAVATPGLPAWTAVLLVVGPAVAGTTSADLDERLASSGGGPVLFAIALAGMYVTTPDTELVRVALGVALPITLLAWPLKLIKLGRGGSYAAVGLFMWIAVLEGIGRSGSIIGAVASLGVLVAEPVGRLVAVHDRGRAGLTRMPAAAAPLPALVATQLVLAFFFARVAGFQSLAARAAVLAVPVGLLAMLGAAALSGGQQGKRRH